MKKVTFTVKGLKNVEKKIIISQQKLREFTKAMSNLNRAIEAVKLTSSKTK